jgi:tryptophanyl-tRNA synthetase
MQSNKKVLFSGMQPTGSPQIGNYFGAIKNWVTLYQDYKCLFCVVDMHAITVRQNSESLRNATLSLAALYIAAGLDPEKNIIYIQSHVPHHAELAWTLNCFTYMGELSRMTQFKDKSAKHADNINAGLFDYPVLMAADILLYQADIVPVGEDQKQHLELTRDIAERFNNIYGQTFVVPEPFIAKQGAHINGLADPTKKMSKSESDTVFLLDSPEAVLKKFKRATTDSDSEIRYSPNEKPGISNLLTIFACATGKTVSEAEKEFEGKGYGQLKTAVAEAVSAQLTPIQEQYNRLMNEQSYLLKLLTENAEKAAEIAESTMKDVRTKVGFLSKI